MLRLVAAILLFITPAVPAAGQVATVGDAIRVIEERAISEAVFDYFHGQGDASAERLNRAFLADKAVMIAVLPAEGGGETVTTYTDMPAVLSRWASNPNPPGAARDGQILDIHITDQRIATVHFRSTDRFYDVLTLVKVDGQWRIVAKVFIRQ